MKPTPFISKDIAPKGSGQFSSRSGFRLGIRSRLTIGFSSLVILFLIAVLFSLSQVREIIQSEQSLQNETHAAITWQAFSQASLKLAADIDQGLLLQDNQFFSQQVEPALNELQASFSALPVDQSYSPELEAAMVDIAGTVASMSNQAQNNAWEAMRNSRIRGFNEQFIRISELSNQYLQTLQTDYQASRQHIADAWGIILRNWVVTFSLSILVIFLATSTTINRLRRQMEILVRGIQRIAGSKFRERLEIEPGEESSRVAEAFNHMAEQMQILFNDQEQVIVERTHELVNLGAQLRASAEVAQAVTTILDPQTLEDHVVNLISDRFNFFHAGIFLLDTNKTYAVLQAASSSGGKRMLARRHRLKVGQGVVGYAIQRGEAHVSQDTSSDVVYFNNPDLPETRSEVALPLRARDQVIGALDVQSTEEKAFREEYVALLQTLADQIALALDNTRLYQEVQARQEEIRRLYGEYNREAWIETIRSRQGISYRFDQDRGLTRGPNDNQAEQVQAVPFPSEEAEILSTPIKIRDKTIGVMKVRKPAKASNWSAEKQAVLETLSEQLGVALDSARLYSETQQQAERERMVGEITTHMRETLDVATVLQTAVDEIYQALELQEITVWLSPELANQSANDSISSEGKG